MMSDLTQDLVEEILSRVPAKSLIRLRATCKRWNALLNEQRFIKEHFRKSAKNFMVLMLNDYKVSPMNATFQGFDRNFASSSTDFKGGFNLTYSHNSSKQIRIYQVFYCDSLLLCTTKDKLVVWNPCNGQTRWIQSSIHCKNNSSEFALGYVNNKSCHNYKILRCWNNSDPIHRVVGFEIYEFSSDSWRVLVDVNLDCCIVQPNGVSVRGNAYWIALDERKEEEILVCFDFSTEKFRRLCLPFQTYDNLTLSTVKEEELSVLHQSYDDDVDIEIWVTTINDKIDQNKVLSWRKFLAMDRYTFFPMFKGNVSFFIDKEKKVVVCCAGGIDETNMIFIIGEDTYIRVPLGKPSKLLPKWPFMFQYAPSLVQIQRAVAISRKRKYRN